MTFAKAVEPNDLVKFLTGKWDNISFEISNGKPVKKEECPETMIVKDPDTLSITAHGFKDGKDLTKDMHLERYVLSHSQIDLSKPLNFKLNPNF